MYVDAFFQRDADIIKVVERDKDGNRLFKEFPVRYTFYYPDARGKFQSIYGEPLSRIVCKNTKDFRKELAIHTNKQLYEADINPIFVCLSENYLNQDAPKLNVAFWDIEVDFDPERGYASPDDAFMPITAISVHLQWLDTLVCLAVPPKKMSVNQAQELVKDFPNTHIFETEAEMLDTFLNLSEDADVLSGWNSEGFDIPYMIMRITRVLSKDDTRRFCLWNQLPRQRTFERFGAENITFDLFGRVHLDYMQLYRKYTYEERHSYSLDAIGEYEDVGGKVAYEGTLDQLYNREFSKFIDYNRQDVMLLAKLDRKLRFLDLANELAHDNTVPLPKVLSAVAVTEQAIINEAHSKGLIVQNRKSSDGDTQAAGAYVAYPKRGMHEYIGAIDINSLYPSAIRALNMAPETIVGQLRPTYTEKHIQDKMTQGASFADAWEGLFGSIEYTAVMNQEPGRELIIDWEGGGSDTMMARDVYHLVFEGTHPWILSANGTIFKYDIKGIVPGLLERWYSERKDLQAKKKDAQTAEDKAFWDKRQLVKKINLNSLYGAILNPGCRFFDKRIGQSTTLTGRTIAKHMDAYLNECITGEYDHVGKAVIYGDTDSCYFSAWPALENEVKAGRMEWSKEICIQLYDSLAEQVNDSFPAFMEQAFHCPREMGSIIKGGRELVADRSLFITKKRYAVRYYDKEGKRQDVEGKLGKIKAMGLDLKRSDTPEFMQKFLEEILERVLNGSQETEILDRITEFRTEFKARPGWEKGAPLS